jgi:hypothetical protein
VEISLQFHRYVFQWLWQMFCIQVFTSGELKGYVQGAGGLTTILYLGLSTPLA